MEGRVAIVTGAARGIGFETARILAGKGVHIVVFDRDAEAVTAAVQKIPGAVGVPGDVTREQDCEAAVSEAKAKWGRLDILINAAGIAGANKVLWELTREEFQQVVDVNLVGTFNMCHAAVPAMLGKPGRIVNFASIAGKDGNPRASHYSASKAGVIALTKSLGKELATEGILVNAIAPAVIETDMASAVSPEQLDYMRGLIPMKRLGQPIEVARLVAFLVSDDLSFSTGAVYDISGGRATY
jgi:2-dehydro-3-deoxy-L-rhamnonate dehydrogenase (NAD+)